MRKLKLFVALAVSALLSVNLMARDNSHAVFHRVTNDNQLNGEHEVIFVCHHDNAQTPMGYTMAAYINGYTTSSSNDMSYYAINRAFTDTLIFDLVINTSTYKYQRSVWRTNINNTLQPRMRTTLRNFYYGPEGGSSNKSENRRLGTYSSYNYLHPYETSTSYCATFIIPGAVENPIQIVTTSEDCLPNTSPSYFQYVYQDPSSDPYANSTQTMYETYVRIPAVSYSGGAMVSLDNTMDAGFPGAQITLPAPGNPAYKNPAYASLIPSLASTAFLGWSTKENDPSAIVGTTGALYTITADTMLYAVYTSTIPTFTFNAGAHGTCDTTSIKVGLPFAMPRVVVEDGYFMKGWRSEDGTILLKPGQTYPNTGEAVLTANHAFTAEYEKIFDIIEWRPYTGSAGDDTLVIKYQYDARQVQARIWQANGTAWDTRYTTLWSSNSYQGMDSCVYRIILPSYTLSDGTGNSYAYEGRTLTLTFYDADTTTTGFRVVNHAACIVPCMTGFCYSTDRTFKAKNMSSYTNVKADTYNNFDLIVGRNYVLTIDGDYTFRNVYVMPGGRLIVPNGNSLTTQKDIILRAGELRGSNYSNMTYKYLYPQLQAEGAVVYHGNFYYEYLFSQYGKNGQMYPFALPYKCALLDVTYADGTPANLDEHFSVDFWDGQYRANQGYPGGETHDHGSGWRWVGTDNPVSSQTEGVYFNACEGYTINMFPQAVGIYPRDSTRLKYGILRFPIHPNLTSGEATTNKSIPVTAFVAPNQDEIYMGWNFITNPFMANFGNVTTTDFETQFGFESSASPIIIQYQGEYLKGLGYVIIPGDDGKSYSALVASGKTLPAFKPFFVQIGKGDNLIFSLKRTYAPAPSFRREPDIVLEDSEKDVRTGLTLSFSNLKDRCGLLIGDNYTDKYEMDYDLVKWYNSYLNVYLLPVSTNLSYYAINPTRAAQDIPVGFTAPGAGVYTFSYDEEQYPRDAVAALYLKDMKTGAVTNLLLDDYQFTISQNEAGKEYKSRFYLSCVRKVPTGVETPSAAAAAALGKQKVLMDGSLFIIDGESIYNAQGQSLAR